MYFYYTQGYTLTIVRLIVRHHCLLTFQGLLSLPQVTARSNTTHTFLSPTLEALTQANRFIVSYQRQDLNVPLDVEYQERVVTGDNTEVVKEISIPGVEYLILVWAVNGSQYSQGALSFTIYSQIAQGKACTIQRQK